MLDNIKRESGESAAMEVLDTLRSLRQMQPRLRMVFTGSIGLHNVISSLSASCYRNSAVNDMLTVDVPPLTPREGERLAQGLIEGESIEVEDLGKVARTISEEVSHIPYYIQYVVDRLKSVGGRVDVAVVTAVVAACVTDAQDAWSLGHYLKRIYSYYSPDEAEFAVRILDVIGGSGRALGFDDVFNLVKLRIVTEDREMVLRVLRLLESDDYIVRTKRGRFVFRFPLVRRWWRYERGLTL